MLASTPTALEKGKETHDEPRYNDDEESRNGHVNEESDREDEESRRQAAVPAKTARDVRHLGNYLSAPVSSNTMVIFPSKLD